VEGDFVSHQAVHTYLTKYRGVKRDTPAADPEKERATVDRLRGRTKAVTTGSIDRLVDRGELDIDSFEVLVDVRIVCDDCGTQYQFGELIDRGGCECR
jgi:hypothetical protein